MKHIFLVSIFLLLHSSLSLALGTNTEDDLKVNDLTQIIDFSIVENQLITTLTYTITYESLTNIPVNASIGDFYDGQFSKIEKMERYTGKKMIKLPSIVTDYESEDVFHSDLKFRFAEFPIEAKGETLKLRYKKVFTDAKFIDPLYFHEKYEVENSKLIINIPSWLTLDIREFNFDFIEPSKTESMDGKIKKTTYVLKDLKKSNSFRGEPNRSKLYPHLILIPNKYDHKKVSYDLIEDVDDLYDWYAGLVKKMDNNQSILQAKVQELTEGKTDDEEKIKAIYYWVQDNIKYIAFEHGIMGFKPDNCQNVYNYKYGDCKGMANLTKEMLNLAGFDARLTWLGTTSKAYTYDTPSLMVDNHMICALLHKGETIFLDPTEKHSDYGSVAYRIQGKEVLIEDGDTYIRTTVPLNEVDTNIEIVEREVEIQDEQLIGSSITKFIGNTKGSILYGLSNSNQTDWKDAITRYLSNSDKNITIELETEPSINHREKDLELEANISLHNQIIDLGNEKYINLEMEREFSSMVLEDDREVPYEMQQPYHYKYTTKLKLPENWKVQYKPEDLKVSNEAYTFNLTHKEEAGHLIYTKEIKITDVWIDVDEFEAWNSLIKKVITIYDDQIILEKK